MSDKQTILIVDDNAMNLDIARDLLESAGYETLDAEDALTGIQLMKVRRPDLVLLDLLMPQMDGFEAIRIMKSDPGIQSIPVVAFTALASGADRDKALEYGCNGIVTKPIDPEQVIKTIQSHLQDRQLSGKPQTVCPRQSADKLDFMITSHPHKVLVVDDNAINVDILKEALESMGQTVLCAYTGEEALRLAQNGRPDLILLDIMMPEINGYVVLETLKTDAATADIPVIVVSALNRTEDRVKGLVQGAADYITKPFEFEEVKARVSAMLRMKDLQDKLKRQRNELEAANKELAEFTTIASHDLQAPLRKIVSFSEYLQKSNRGQLHDEEQDLLQRIHGSADKMQKLVQNLLNLSRAGYHGRDLKPTDLSLVVRDALDDLGELQEQTGAQVHVGDLPIIQADEVQIRQVMSNLLSNAMKFHREGVEPVINVSACRLDSGAVEITVKDNGIGFSEAQAERIFKPFERVNGSAEYSGTGIGLAICKKVAERHGGTITATSVFGKGSNFILKLPIHTC